MAAPDRKRQRNARKTLKNLFDNAGHVWVTHYSCESFYNRPEGRSPRITSIALRNLKTAQTISFSIHQVAERSGVAPDDISAQYDILERQMLSEFYAHVGAHLGDTYLHWNMRDINFGFAAIEHRFRVLGGTPTVVPDNRKVDLARLIIEMYGAGYIGHPRLEKLIQKNKISPLAFMSGEQEAQAFEAENYVGLHQSTLRKVDIFENIAVRALDNELKTNATWWELRGGRALPVPNWVAENKFILFGLAAVVVVLAVVAFWR